MPVRFCQPSAMPVLPSRFARAMSAVVCTCVMRSACSTNHCFQRITFCIVPLKPSHMEQVQFAAVRPPRRMSSNTVRLKLAMISPSKTVRLRCSSCILRPYTSPRAARSMRSPATTTSWCARSTSELALAAVLLRVDVGVPLGLVAHHAAIAAHGDMQQLPDADVLVAVGPHRRAVGVLVAQVRRTDDGQDFVERHAGAEVLEVVLGEQFARVTHAVVGAEGDAFGVVGLARKIPVSGAVSPFADRRR